MVSQAIAERTERERQEVFESLRDKVPLRFALAPYEGRLGSAGRGEIGVHLESMRCSQLSPRPVLRTWWFRLLDGAHVWGSFDAMVGRYGLRRYRLVVFQPGISAFDRRLLRMWRAWPVGGGMLAMLTVMLLGDAVASPGTTLAVVAAAYAGVWVALFVVVTDARAEVRSMSLLLLAGDHDSSDRIRYAEWEALVDLLTSADDKLNAGTIAPAQHEALWWQAYEHLGVHAHV